MEISAEQLRDITEKALINKASDFWEEFSPNLFDRLKRTAEGGADGFKIMPRDTELNPYDWLTYPTFYNKVRFKLEKLGYTVTHSADNDVYMYIAW